MSQLLMLQVTAWTVFARTLLASGQAQAAGDANMLAPLCAAPRMIWLSHHSTTTESIVTTARSASASVYALGRKQTALYNMLMINEVGRG